MPRYNVHLPDGRWRVFSTVCDDFVSPPMGFEELRTWRRLAYGAQDGLTDKETDSLLTDKPMVNVMGYDEAMGRMVDQ